MSEWSKLPGITFNEGGPLREINFHRAGGSVADLFEAASMWMRDDAKSEYGDTLQAISFSIDELGAHLSLYLT